MKISAINKEQFMKIVKTALYIGVSAILDYLISVTTGSQFGIYTGFVNIALVALKQLITPTK